jgi:hypothetical protein
MKVVVILNNLVMAVGQSLENVTIRVAKIQHIIVPKSLLRKLSLWGRP